jgi:hypothetical protein
MYTKSGLCRSAAAGRFRVDPRDELAAFQANRNFVKQQKEAWEADHPTWPLDANLRRQSGFVFSEEEISEGMEDVVGLVLGFAGFAANLLGAVARLRASMASGEEFNPMDPVIIEQIVGMIIAAVASKKIGLKKAKKLLKEALSKVGVDSKIAKAAAKKIQDVANAQFKKLIKQKGFKKLDAFQKGTALDKAVKGELLEMERQLLKDGSPFSIHFEEPLSLGSGKSHPGSNVDVVLAYKMTAIVRMELKMSFRAIDPDRSQTRMLVHDALAPTLDMLTIFFTPTKLYVLPSIDNGIMFEFKDGKILVE